MADIGKAGPAVETHSRHTEQDAGARPPKDLGGTELDQASRRFQNAAGPRKGGRGRSGLPGAEHDLTGPGPRAMGDRRRSGDGLPKDLLLQTAWPGGAGSKNPSGPHDLSEGADALHRALPDKSGAFEEMAALQGERVLQGLQGLPEQVEAQSTPTEAAPSKLSEIVEKLTDRILVSAPEAGQAEVRIKLNMDTLQGTEILLARDANGLNVRFDAPSSDIARLLDSAMPGLKEVLEQSWSEKHKGEGVRIEVGTAKAGGDANDTGDGRSRNRRDLRDELSDERE